MTSCYIFCLVQVYIYIHDHQSRMIGLVAVPDLATGLAGACTGEL